MGQSVAVAVPAGEITVVFTDRSDGSFAIADHDGGLAARRRRITPTPWTWLRQVHGDRVVTVTDPGHHAGVEADGAVTATPGCPVAVMAADCAPVVLIAERGVGVVHAGWRGLVAGVVERSADRLQEIAGPPVTSLIGPCINPAAYEFGAEDLAAVVARFGERVRSRTSWGTSALDVPEAVAAACERAGWPPPADRPPCTSDERWHSHRTRAEVGRQATVAWLTPANRERPDDAGGGSGR